MSLRKLKSKYYLNKKFKKKKKKCLLNVKLNQMKENILEELVELRIERDVSNWMTALTITDFVFEVSEHYFKDF